MGYIKRFIVGNWLMGSWRRMVRGSAVGTLDTQGSGQLRCPPSPPPRAGEEGVRLQDGQAQRARSLPLPSFCPGSRSTGGGLPTPGGQSSDLSPLLRMPIAPQDTDTLRILLDQTSGHPMAQASGHMALTITDGLEFSSVPFLPPFLQNSLEQEVYD